VKGKVVGQEVQRKAHQNLPRKRKHYEENAPGSTSAAGKASFGQQERARRTTSWRLVNGGNPGDDLPPASDNITDERELDTSGDEDDGEDDDDDVEEVEGVIVLPMTGRHNASSFIGSVCVID
jgi:hypothetical protein